MNFELILKASLVAFCVTLLEWVAILIILRWETIDNTHRFSTKFYLLLGFLLNTVWSGAHVYRNSTEYKAGQAVIAILSVPSLLVLFMIFRVLISTLPGGI
jgi:hypothetical protein